MKGDYAKYPSQQLYKAVNKMRTVKKDHKKRAYSTNQMYWKQSEGELGEFLNNHDDVDEFYGQWQSKRGRVGHHTFLETDVITKNWNGENKKMEKSFNKDFTKFVLKNLKRSIELKKFPVLRLDIQEELEPNDLDLKRMPPLVVIPEEVFGRILDMIPEEEIE